MVYQVWGAATSERRGKVMIVDERGLHIVAVPRMPGGVVVMTTVVVIGRGSAIMRAVLSLCHWTGQDSVHL